MELYTLQYAYYAYWNQGMLIDLLSLDLFGMVKHGDSIDNM